MLVYEVCIEVYSVFQLAKYCDSLLKKSTKHLSELEIDARLNNVVSIFLSIPSSCRDQKAKPFY